MDAVAILESEVRELVRTHGIDPVRDRTAFDGLLDAAREDYERRAGRGAVPPLLDLVRAERAVRDAVAGLGPLQRYLDDPEIEEIWVNSPSRVFVARGGTAELTPTILTSGQVADLVERMLEPTGRRIDVSSPFVDASLPGGERLHVVIPDVTREWSLNIRKFVARARSLDDLVALGTLTAPAARFLDACVRAGLNVLVAGSTHAGKTTLVNALGGSIPADERVIVCEEVFELRLPGRDVVGMQCRQPSLEGTGEIPLRRLVKEALRMRPDRIVVGEVREAEAFDLLVALSSGIPGMCTLHAGSAREAVAKMCTLPLLAGENVTSGFVVPSVATSLDVVVHLARDARGARRVREIALVTGRVESGVVELAEIYRTERDALVRGAGHPVSTEPFTRVGIDVAALLRAGD
ncbi:CpaF family protein [Sanguibacter massiliensis]|uniref:CpaF family protein n=1 Tax=Sanguibacter massiliensis TaxID=1973217 RepID=UPI000C84BDA6|nr:ATPase, T2SS/T4P/T4SS family [Sanguibacter massiliensis]